MAINHQTLEKPGKARGRSSKAKTSGAPGEKSSSKTKARPDKAFQEIRQAKLERARRLLEDAQYPSDEVIESVADLLARTWQREREIAVKSAG